MMDDIFGVDVEFDVLFDDGDTFDVTMDDYDPSHSMYPGPYLVTPSDEMQILPIDGKTAAQNIVVEAIPDNYGRIRWDGSGLMIY